MITADQHQAEIERYLKNVEAYILGVRLQLAAMREGRGSPDLITGMIHHMMCSTAHAGTCIQDLASLPKSTLADELHQAAGRDDTLQKLIKRVSQKTPIRAGAKRKMGGTK